MLSDIERRFMAADPEFARSFQHQLRKLPPRQGGSNGKIAIAVAMLCSAILLPVGFATSALACVAVTGVLWAMWWCSKGSDARAP